MSKRSKKDAKRKQVVKVKQQGPAKGYYWLAAILAAAFLAYIPLLKGQFINYDDDIYILENPLIQQLSFDNIKALFSEFFGNQYAPMAMLIMGLEFKAFGGSTVLLKLASILLHLFNTVLVFQLVTSLFKKKEYAIITAALFALNPIQVESVGWMSASMKVGTSTLFFLAALLFYIKYTKENGGRHYALSLGFFLLSCLCKEQAITLAVTLPAVDYLLGRNWLNKRAVLEKLPFLSIAIVFGLATIMASRGIEQNLGVFQFGFFERFLFASYAIVAYWVNALAPVNLTFFNFYPQPGHIPATFYLSIILVLAMAAGFYWAARKGNKVIVFGMAFFFINSGLILASQLMAVRDVMMADRYIYLSSLGIFLAVAEGYRWLSGQRPGWQQGIVAGLGIYVLVLAGLSFQRTQVFTDSISLLSDVIEKAQPAGGQLTPALALPYTNRGQARKANNDLQGAMADYSQAIAVNPGYDMAYSNRGNLYFNQGDYAKAIEDYNRAIGLNPKASKALSSRGAAYAAQGNYPQALADLNRALELEPGLYDALSNRMLVHYYLQDFPASLADCNRLLEMDPQVANIINFRGTLYQKLGRMQEAETDFNQSIQLEPNDGSFYLNRSAFYQQNGNNTKALQDALKARSLGANVDDNYINSLR